MINGLSEWLTELAVEVRHVNLHQKVTLNMSIMCSAPVSQKRGGGIWITALDCCDILFLFKGLGCDKPQQVGRFVNSYGITIAARHISVKRFQSAFYFTVWHISLPVVWRLKADIFRIFLFHFLCVSVCKPARRPRLGIWTTFTFMNLFEATCSVFRVYSKHSLGFELLTLVLLATCSISWDPQKQTISDSNEKMPKCYVSDKQCTHIPAEKT